MVKMPITVIVRIGFENTSYTVDESTRTQEVCVRVFVADDIELPLENDLFVAVQTVAGTAGKTGGWLGKTESNLIVPISDETDYSRIDPLLGNVVIFFNNADRRRCFDLGITDDDLVEGEEDLTLILFEDPFQPPQIMVEFSPNVTEVTIVDMDGTY